MKELKPSTWKLLAGLVAALSVLVFIKNAWVSEDAFIVFRSIEQLFAGHGPIWNPEERVQVYTSPLWYWVLALTRTLSNDLFLNVILLSLALWLALLCCLWRWSKDSSSFLVTLSLLLCSSAFFDFTSSGLENILAYVLLVLFLTAFVGAAGAKEADLQQGNRVDSTTWCLLLSGLLLVVRHDLLLLVLPPSAYLAWRNLRRLPRQKAAMILLSGGLPLAGWTLFSILYYGYPFPNTAYAKLNTGMARSDLFAKGFTFLSASVAFDSLTLVVILLVLVELLSSHRRPEFLFLGLGILLHLDYLVWIGGDFMQGRFLSYSLLLSAALLPTLVRWPKSSFLPAIVLLWAYALFFPHTPVNSPVNYENQLCLTHGTLEPVPDSIVDERGFYFRYLSFAHYLQLRSLGLPFPDHPWAEDTRSNPVPPGEVLVSRNIGMRGYLSPLDLTIVDPLALADPLLAQIRVKGPRRIGHYSREIPPGYLESLRQNRPLLEDPGLNAFYEKVRLITRSQQLFGWERLKTIFWMNLARYESLKAEYEAGL